MERLAKVPGVSVGALPVTVSEKFMSGSKDAPAAAAGVLSEPPSKKLPSKLWSSLLPFQKQGVEYAVKHNGRVLLADEMVRGICGSPNVCLTDHPTVRCSGPWEIHSSVGNCSVLPGRLASTHRRSCVSRERTRWTALQVSLPFSILVVVVCHRLPPSP
jgi:hypothetical protein